MEEVRAKFVSLIYLRLERIEPQRQGKKKDEPCGVPGRQRGAVVYAGNDWLRNVSWRRAFSEALTGVEVQIVGFSWNESTYRHRYICAS